MVALCITLGLVYVAASSVIALSNHAQSSLAETSSARANADTRVVLDAYVSGYLAKDSALRHWNLRSQEVTCVAVETTDTYCSATYQVHRVHTLNCPSAAEWPAVKGRLKYMQDHGRGLNEEHRVALQRDVDMWVKEISSYIAEPQDCYDTLQVIGLNGPGPAIDPSTIRVYGQGPEGEFIGISLGQIPSPADVERAAYEGTAELLAGIKATGVAPLALYNRLAARDYANRYTSSPLTYMCGTNPNPGCIQDTRKYNTAYAYICCNDCANFVSQSVAAGGILPDTVWKPGNSEWNFVPNLVTYMTVTNNYWQVTTLGNCVAGYPIVPTPTHIVLMVYNDGITRKYSAHTNDRLQANWYNPPEPVCYRVIY